MFALIETLRPRRYAELGSHYGASFFAACQTAQKIRTPADFVAIDLWEGDPQAGFYGEEVYEAFEGIRLKHYADVWDGPFDRTLWKLRTSFCRTNLLI